MKLLNSWCRIMNKMVNVTLSMSKEKKKKLDEIAKQENRKRSNQVIHMMEFYLEYKDKVK